MLKVTNFHLNLPNFSLKNINLEIQKGDFFALIGPTGSGKSLLLEAIMGIIPSNSDNSGKIYLNEQDITHLSPEARGLGIVYQDSALFPHLTARQNITYGLKYNRINKDKAKKQFDFLVKKLGITHILDRYPPTLSGGEKQRVALARVLILNPQAILLDEPLSALDPAFQEEIRELLKSLHQELQITFIMVSHNFTEVLYLADSGAIIHQGRIVQQDKIQHIFHHPNSCFIANFVGIKNVFPARINANKAFINGLEIKLGSESDRQKHNYFSIRPEEIILLSRNKARDNTVDNVFTGYITKISCQGFYFNVFIDVYGVKFQAIWSHKDVADYSLNVGKQVTIGFSSKAVHTFFEN
ncbi:ABC transporter ATP-binding protein [Desulfovulcanus sp.]